MTPSALWAPPTGEPIAGPPPYSEGHSRPAPAGSAYPRTWDRRESALPPPTYFWPALLCLLICLPTGLVAMLNSVRVTRRVQVGDRRGAVRSSRLARTWCLVSLLIGGLAFLLAMAGVVTPSQ